MNEITIKNILAEELFGNRICESLEDKEIVDFFYKEFLLEKFLYGEPISVPELRKLLRKKIVNFEFIKIDGDVRPARGTTRLDYIPKEDHPKGIRPSSDAVATFFDLDKDAWRSVSKKSKEIVLKKDEEKGKPIIVVRDKEEELKKKGKDIEKLGPEPTDELKVGDLRNYLNRNNKNIFIKIVRVDDDGSIYAETFREGTPFKIPASRIRNIGEKVTPEQAKALVKPWRRAVRPVSRVAEVPKEPEEPEVPEEPEMKPVTPETPEGEGKIIELIPREESPAKEPPEEVDDREDAEELEK